MKTLPKAVVFDFGGVMTATRQPERAYRLAASFGIDKSVLEDGFARYRRLMDGGFILCGEMYDNILADAGIDLAPALRAEIAAEDFASFTGRNERTLAWMRKLKAEGFKIGILTNMSLEMAPLFRTAFADFIALADAMVVSGEVRMFKPQPRIYRCLRDRLRVDDRDILFVDDSPENCEAARALGWQTVQFRSNDQAEAEFDA